MAPSDTCCTLVPYFKVQDGKIEEFKALCEQFVERTATEEAVLHYGFSFDDHEVHCREGYVDADGILTHLDNVGALLEQALEISEITRLEVHGPAGEIDKLRDPLSDLGPQFFTLEYGFRR